MPLPVLHEDAPFPPSPERSAHGGDGCDVRVARVFCAGRIGAELVLHGRPLGLQCRA